MAVRKVPNTPNPECVRLSTTCVQNSEARHARTLYVRKKTSESFRNWVKLKFEIKLCAWRARVIEENGNKRVLMRKRIVQDIKISELIFCAGIKSAQF